MSQRLDVRYVNFYSAGSSALKVTPAIPLETLTLPKRKKLRRITLHIDPVALAGIAMAAVMMILMAVGFSELVTAREAEVTMAAYVDTLEKENAALEEAFVTALDLDAVERNALALGMVPAEQAEQVVIQVSADNKVEQPNSWSRFLGILADFFA